MAGNARGRRAGGRAGRNRSPRFVSGPRKRAPAPLAGVFYTPYAVLCSLADKCMCWDILPCSLCMSRTLWVHSSRIHVAQEDSCSRHSTGDLQAIMKFGMMHGRV